MSKRKKNLLNAAFVLIVFALTVYSVFAGKDLSEIAETITEADPWFLAMGALCVVIFILGESTILHYMFRTLNIRTRRRTCFMYSCVGFFFSCITPSAGGGQPAQILFMRRNKISVPVATVVLMIVTITYKLVLVAVGCFLVIFRFRFLHQYLWQVMPIFYLGLALNIFCCVAMLILVFHTSLARNIVLSILDLLGRFRLLKGAEAKKERIAVTMDHYGDTAAFLKQNMRVLLNVLLLTFIQRFSLFFVTYFVYRAFGLSGTAMWKVVLLQASISVSVDMLPLPGGMGISEHLFLTIFDPIFYGDLLIPAMILSRGISYYVQLIFSAIVTAGANLLMKRPAAGRQNT